jgi:superfamily II DNA or RNA helicase
VTFNLRPYQEVAVEQTGNLLYKKGMKSGVIHLFTGGGKSLVTAVNIDKYANPIQGKRTLIVGGINRVLVLQMHYNLKKYFGYMGGNITLPDGRLVPAAGVVMGDINQTNARTVVASIQSLITEVDVGRLGKAEHILSVPLEKKDLIVDKFGNVRKNPNNPRPFLVSPRIDQMLEQGGTFDLWYPDECHHAVSDSQIYLVHMLQQIRALLDLPPMKIIGNTATPKRTDERGLHTLFETIIVSYTVPWGQRHGYLVPFWEEEGKQAERVLIDEYETDEMGNGTSTENRTTIRYVDNWAEIVAQAYLDRMQGRRCFGYWSQYNGAGPVEDSIWVTATMNAMGIKAAHVDADKCINEFGTVLPKNAAGKLLDRLACGDLSVINNYNIFVEGVDVPEVDGILLGRRISADNPVLLTQIMGRGLRPAPGKENLKLLDFTGQQLVLDGVADLMGYTVDPFTGAPREDINWQLVIEQFMGLWRSRPEDVEKWIYVQKRYKEKTIREAINRALRGEEMEEVHIRALNECYEFCSDEDRLSEGMDLRDQREQNMVHGKNTTYVLTRIITKSSGAWHADPVTAMMSLPVGHTDSFIINPPNHTNSRIADAALLALSSDEENALKAGKTPEQLAKMLEFFTVAKELYENFTGWHIVGAYWEAQNKHNLWALADPALDVLEDDLTAYSKDIEGYTAAFSDKKKTKSWGKDPATEKQMRALAQVSRTSLNKMPEEWRLKPEEGGIGKGGVAKLITHYAAQNVITPIIEKFNQAIKKAEELL